VSGFPWSGWGAFEASRGCCWASTGGYGRKMGQGYARSIAGHSSIVPRGTWDHAGSSGPQCGL